MSRCSRRLLSATQCSTGHRLLCPVPGLARAQFRRPTLVILAIVGCTSDRGELLREVMHETNVTQSWLSRVSGVHQPSISQFLSGKVQLSDEQLDRLLSCMGYRLEVVRRPVVPHLTRSERRSWRLHRQLSTHLTRFSLEEWRPTIERKPTSTTGPC